MLAQQNVNRDNLLSYAREAADFCTSKQLPHLDFAVNAQNSEDIAMFDFTSMYAAENAAIIFEMKGHRLLTCLAGDSLIEVCITACQQALRPTHTPNAIRQCGAIFWFSKVDKFALCKVLLKIL